MKKLIQLDKLDGNRKGVLRKITDEGQIVTTLATTFSASEIANPEIFPSLLFYYGYADDHGVSVETGLCWAFPIITCVSNIMNSHWKNIKQTATSIWIT